MEILNPFFDFIALLLASFYNFYPSLGFAIIGLTLVVMIVLIVGCDVLFLRDRFGLRLAVNVAIVIVFGAFETVTPGTISGR